MAQGSSDHFDLDDLKEVEAYFTSADPAISSFTAGGFIGSYERELAHYHGRRHAILLNSGTSALYAAFYALGVGPGDEVIAPCVTFPATITPALRLGAAVTLVDIDPETYNICPAAVEETISTRTKAIVYTNMWGYPADATRLMRIGREYGIPVVEDNSLSMCASLDGVLTGTQADICCFSLGSTKLFSGGQGGALLTNEQSYFEQALLLSYFGPRAQQECLDLNRVRLAETGVGMNLRINTLAAVVSRGRFRRRDALMSHRRLRFDLITRSLGAFTFVKAPTETASLKRGIWQGFVASIDLNDARRQHLYRAIDELNLPIRKGFYYRPLHHTPLFAASKHNSAIISADACYRNALSFPIFYQEPLDRVAQIADQISQALQMVR